LKLAHSDRNISTIFTSREFLLFDDNQGSKKRLLLTIFRLVVDEWANKNSVLWFYTLGNHDSGRN
jgi:hypothetical protein